MKVYVVIAWDEESGRGSYHNMEIFESRVKAEAYLEEWCMKDYSAIQEWDVK